MSRFRFEIELMLRTIELFDKWYALKSSRWGSWEDWWRHWVPTFSRVASYPHGRNSPTWLHLCGRFTCTPPLNNPNYAHSLQSWGKSCFNAGPVTVSRNQKVRNSEKFAQVIVVGEALVMDWRRVLTTTTSWREWRLTILTIALLHIAHSPPLVSAPTSAPVIAPPVCSLCTTFAPLHYYINAHQ